MMQSRGAPPKYRIVALLGEGGMGVVYRAIQHPLGREVALKVLKNQDQDPELLRRFAREQQALIELSHPGVVKILDAGEFEGRHFYVMEYLVDARPLDRLIREDGPLPPARALDVALQLCDALACCHGEGLVHRDVKPANVMLTGGGRAILMDFGLVKNNAISVLTRTGDVVGTPRYLSPERVRGEDGEAAGDLWGVGVVLYEMLTGLPPFSGANLTEILQAILRATPRPPSELRSKLSPALDRVVLAFLGRDPTTRPGSARVAHALIRNSVPHDAPEPIPRRRASKPPLAPVGRSLAPILFAGAALSVVGALSMQGPPRRPPVPAAVHTSAEPAPAPLADAEVARLLITRLRALDPASLSRELLAEIQRGTPGRRLTSSRKLLDEVPSQSPEDHAAAIRALVPEATRARARARLEDRLAAVRLREALAMWTRTRGLLDPAALPPAEVRGLYELLDALADLDELSVRAGLVAGGFGEGLCWTAYGQLASGEMPRAAGVALLLDRDRRTFQLRSAPGPDHTLRFPAEPATQFRLHADPREAHEMADELGSVSAPGYTHREAMWSALPEGARAFDLAVLTDGAGRTGGFRVLAASRPDAPAAEWRLLARVRQRAIGPVLALHSLPVNLLPEGPLFLRVELVYAPWRKVLLSHARQSGRVRWVVLAPRF